MVPVGDLAGQGFEAVEAREEVLQNCLRAGLGNSEGTGVEERGFGGADRSLGGAGLRLNGHLYAGSWSALCEFQGRASVGEIGKKLLI